MAEISSIHFTHTLDLSETGDLDAYHTPLGIFIADEPDAGDDLGAVRVMLTVQEATQLAKSLSEAVRAFVADAVACAAELP